MVEVTTSLFVKVVVMCTRSLINCTVVWKHNSPDTSDAALDGTRYAVDAEDVLFRRVLNKQHHLLHSLLPVMVTTCDVGAMIASSHTMMISATLFTDKFINTVIKHSLLSLFHCLIAFWQFLINEYGMSCRWLVGVLPWTNLHRRRFHCLAICNGRPAADAEYDTTHLLRLYLPSRFFPALSAIHHLSTPTTT